MTAPNPNQLVGIELELYCRDGVEGLQNYKNDNSLDQFKVTGDGSLDNNGAEIKFANGVELSHTGEYIDILHTIACDNSILHTEFSKSSPENTYNNIYTGRKPITRLGGETGLHIHLGLPESVMALDIMRLVKNTTLNLQTIQEKAWRINNRWAGTTMNHVSNIHNSLQQISTGQQRVMSFADTKYQGLNLNNINRTRLNTIEFRFGHAALLTDELAFNEYMNTILNIWNDSFTGEPSLEWGNATLTEDVPTSTYNMRKITMESHDTSHVSTFDISYIDDDD